MSRNIQMTRETVEYDRVQEGFFRGQRLDSPYWIARLCMNFYLRVLSGWAHLASLYGLVLEQSQHAFCFSSRVSRASLPPG